jgi:threonyl-tRNA synthetase
LIVCSPEAEPGKVYRPVIIHRAILGSVERMIAILTENYGGKWPFWLSPRQVCVVPVAHAHFEYAKKVKAKTTIDRFRHGSLQRKDGNDVGRFDNNYMIKGYGLKWI